MRSDLIRGEISDHFMESEEFDWLSQLISENTLLTDKKLMIISLTGSGKL